MLQTKCPRPTFVFTVCAVCNYVGYARAFVTRLFDFSFQQLRFGPQDCLRCTIVSSRLLAMVVHLFFNGQGLVSGKPYPPHTRPLSVPRAHFLFPREAALAAPSSRVPWRAALETSVVERSFYLCGSCTTRIDFCSKTNSCRPSFLCGVFLYHC